jgi:hypothetical protein
MSAVNALVVLEAAEFSITQSWNMNGPYVPEKGSVKAAARERSHKGPAG